MKTRSFTLTNIVRWRASIERFNTRTARIFSEPHPSHGLLLALAIAH